MTTNLMGDLVSSFTAKQAQLTAELQSDPHPAIAREILKAIVAGMLAVETAHRLSQVWLEHTTSLSATARQRIDESAARLGTANLNSLVSGISDPEMRKTAAGDLRTSFRVAGYYNGGQ